MSHPSDLAVLTLHGRSFRLAGRLLGRRTFRQAAGLYAVCRAVDDLADEAPDPLQAQAALRELHDDIRDGHGATMLGRRLLELGVDRAASLMLVETMLSDLQPVRIADEAALLRYAHGAAGTVGLMMCDVLQVTAEAARSRAVDLGIAMQLTNIARDVCEDAARDRIYLPRTWLPSAPAPAELLLDRHATYRAVQRVLELAEQYYSSGAIGYVALPGRAALAIPAAAALYREIGRRILRVGPAYLGQPRHVIPPLVRGAVAARCVLVQLVAVVGRHMMAASPEPNGWSVGRLRLGLTSACKARSLSSSLGNGAQVGEGGWVAEVGRADPGEAVTADPAVHRV